MSTEHPFVDCTRGVPDAHTLSALIPWTRKGKRCSGSRLVVAATPFGTCLARVNGVKRLWGGMRIWIGPAAEGGRGTMALGLGAVVPLGLAARARALVVWRSYGDPSDWRAALVVGAP